MAHGIKMRKRKPDDSRIWNGKVDISEGHEDREGPDDGVEGADLVVVVVVNVARGVS